MFHYADVAKETPGVALPGENRDYLPGQTHRMPAVSMGTDIEHPIALNGFFINFFRIR